MHRIEKRLVYCDVVYKMYKMYPGFCDTICVIWLKKSAEAAILY